MMKYSKETRGCRVERLDRTDGGYYAPGAFQEEAKAFFRQCVGDQEYARIMSLETGRRHPYVAARVFLSQTDWEKFVWIEQHGSLDGFPG